MSLAHEKFHLRLRLVQQVIVQVVKSYKDSLLSSARGGARRHGGGANFHRLALYVAGGEGKIKLIVCISLAMM